MKNLKHKNYQVLNGKLQIIASFSKFFDASDYIIDNKLNKEEHFIYNAKKSNSVQLA